MFRPVGCGLTGAVRGEPPVPVCQVPIRLFVSGDGGQAGGYGVADVVHGNGRGNPPDQVLGYGRRTVNGDA